MSAAKHRDVRRMLAPRSMAYATTYGDDLGVKPEAARNGENVIPVAVVDLRPEAVERLEHRLVHAIGAWESNKYGRRTSLGNRASQARAVLAAVLGRLPKKP